MPLILCISPTGVCQPQITTKAGEVLYVVAFIELALIAAVIMHKLGNASGAEKRLAWGILLALHVYLIRLCYYMISVFAHNSQFNLITGSVIIHVFMAVLDELIVVIIYLVVGLRSNVLTPTDNGPINQQTVEGQVGWGRCSPRLL